MTVGREKKGKKYATSKGRSRHADFRGAIDQENVKKRGGGGVEKAALLPKIPLPRQMGDHPFRFVTHFTFWNRPIFRAFLPYTTPLKPSLAPLPSSSCFFSTRGLYLLLASPPFRGGTFVKEGLPLFREPTPPLIFRDDRSVPAFLIVHHCFQWILLFQVALFMELREDLSRRLEWHELIFTYNCK